MHRCGSSMRRRFAVMLVACLATATVVAAAETPATSPSVTPAAGAGAGAASAKKTEATAPVRISAEAAEYFSGESRIVFTGNVIAVQSDSTLTADRMEVTFSQPERAPGKPAGGIVEASTGRRILAITALRNVSFRQVDPETGKERYGTAEKGVYDAERRLVTMTGNPRLWEEKNVIAGEEMTFRIDEKHVVVKGKVNLTVYPEDQKEATKP